MPLLQPDPIFIDEPIRPTTVDGLVFQRQLRYVSFAPAQHPDTGEMSVLLTVQVRHFLTQPDGTAAYAPTLVPSRLEVFVANNSEALDTATGEIVRTQVQQTNEEWLAECDADPRTLMLRGAAYAATMHGGDVDMVEPIRAAMRAADGPPYYRFGQD